jgi:hypothetical protein
MVHFNLPKYTFEQYIDALGMNLSGINLKNKYPEYSELHNLYSTNVDIHFLNYYIDNKHILIQEATKSVLQCLLKNCRYAKNIYNILLDHLIIKGGNLFVLTPLLFEIKYSDYGNVIFDSKYFELIASILMNYHKILNIKYIKECTNWKNIILDDDSIDKLDTSLSNKVNINITFDTNNNINQEEVFKYIKIAILLLPWEHTKNYDMNDFIQLFV